MAKKQRSALRQKSMDGVRSVISVRPQVLTEELMPYTAEEFFATADLVKIIFQAWRTHTRHVLRQVRGDMNLPVAFNRPTPRGREYVNVEIADNLEALYGVLNALVEQRDSRNLAIEKVKMRIEMLEQQKQKRNDAGSEAEM